MTKYGVSFAQSAMKRDLKVLGRMIQWHLFETDKIVYLRNQLRRGLDVILLIQSQAQGYVCQALWRSSILWHLTAVHVNRIEQEQNQSLVFAKLEALSQLEEQVNKTLDDHFDQIADAIQQQSKMVADVCNSLAGISPSLLVSLQYYSGLYR